MVSQTSVTLPVTASTSDYCEVNAFFRSDCGDSSNTTATISCELL